MIQQLLTIARNTFTESIRQPIYVVLLLIACLALVINPSLAAYTIEDDTKLLIDLGLSTVLLAGLLLAAFTATGVLANEIEQRTVLTVVSKPVSRALFVLGKFLGVAAAIALAYYMLSIIMAMTVRHQVLETVQDQMDMPVITLGILATLIALGIATAANYLHNRPFTSTFVLAWAPALTIVALMLLFIDRHWQFQSPIDQLTYRDGELLQVSVGLVVIFFAVLILSAVAIAASTRLGQVMTLIVCIGVFLLGLVSHALSVWTRSQLQLPIGITSTEKLQAIYATDVSLPLKLIYTLAELIYIIIPNLQFLWHADAITQGNPLTLNHVAILALYALLYVAALLSLAIALFQTREVG